MGARSSPTVTVVADPAAVAAHAADIVRRCATESASAHGRFTLLLSGGSTPKALYERLAQEADLPWAHTELCFGDERAVPPDHPESNARMVHAALTHQPFVPPSHVHRIRGELPAHEAAKAYEATLRGLFDEVDFPPFDLALLGLGNDGHTASLFPHSPALAERTKWVVAQRVDKLGRERITLTYPALNAARAIVFLVAGADKAEALRAVLEGDQPIDEIPARGIAPPMGTVTFVADAAAAGRLTTY